MIRVDVDITVPTEVPEAVEQLLEEAVLEALLACLDGRPGWAEYLLARAALKVAHLVECAESVEQLGDLVYLVLGEAAVPVAGGVA